MGSVMFKGTGGQLTAPVPTPCLSFTSQNEFALSVNNPGWDGTMEYSTDTVTWNTWDGSEISGTALYLRGTGNTMVTGSYDDSRKWTLTGSNIACTGNIENLLDYQTVVAGNHPAMAGHCYGVMFYGCTSLTTAPELPATTLVWCCYYQMFYGCTSLTTAPELPAKTLAGRCYYSMFRGCTSLTTAPALPATTLDDFCYNYMFYGCTSLTTAPALPATTMQVSCYDGMFYGCTSLTTAPELPAKTLAHSCYDDMFRGCTSLTTAPALPATKLAHSCYYQMFYGCTSLTTAPALPATTLDDFCYYQMFYGCTSLTTAPALPATKLAYSCYTHMFYVCRNLKLSATQTADYTQPYRIPTSGTGTVLANALVGMFFDTGGTFTGTPEVDTTYYLHMDNTIV